MKSSDFHHMGKNPNCDTGFWGIPARAEVTRSSPGTISEAPVEADSGHCDAALEVVDKVALVSSSTMELQ